MSEAPKQLILDLPHREAHGVEDFLVTSANQVAVDLVDRWPGWPAPAVLLHGGRGTGKSHLTSVWLSRSGAHRFAYPDIGPPAVEALKTDGALAVEDVTEGGDERQLFHLLNLARETAGAILITSDRPAGDLTIALPDLRSRLRALPSAELSPPDDLLLQGLLVKLFADRQLRVGADVIAYLRPRIERSFAAAGRIVAALDQAALARRRPITPRLAAEVLREVEGEGEGEGGDLPGCQG